MCLSLDYFLMSFPNDPIEVGLKETNKQLRHHQKGETRATKLYKLVGIRKLITRFEITSRAWLWLTVFTGQVYFSYETGYHDWNVKEEISLFP